MKQRVADYVADFLVKNNIEHVFTVTGGGAMHLNDALGHKEGLYCVYNHHEQACAMAAESYARINNKIAAVCVTTGPGGTNTITGVLGGWLDSIPMLIISGQVRYDTTARSTGLNIRAMGDQEYDITQMVSNITKYAQMITKADEIRYHLEKALYLAKTGRPGPSWLDIPVNIQSAIVETDNLTGFDVDKYIEQNSDSQPPKVSDELALDIIKRIKNAKRPVINAGNGIRIAGAYKEFLSVVEKLRIPVVTGWNSIDLIADDNPYYVGRGGIMGDRPGNWAMQTSDLILSIGSRLSIRQVGYNFAAWAPEAFTIVEDIDQEELKKPSIHVDIPIWADAKDFLQTLDRNIKQMDNHDDWVKVCQYWKTNYPVIMEKHYDKTAENANVYGFMGSLSSSLMPGQITVVGNGSACVVGSHSYVIKENQRFIINSGVASMGYDLPAAIGACFASGKEDIVCISGDGSIQMNIQELQTIIHHKLPIKIFVINNGGYHSIRQTQKNFFGDDVVGIGNDSGDLSFPSMEKLSAAYGYDYYKIKNNCELDRIKEIVSTKGPLICEVFVDTVQKFEPKSATKKLEDGTLVSSSLNDLAPFLPQEELENVLNMAYKIK